MERERIRKLLMDRTPRGTGSNGCPTLLWKNQPVLSGLEWIEIPNRNTDGGGDDDDDDNNKVCDLNALS
jgi:hypothetical protein